MNPLKVFSGECCLCDVGMNTGHEDVSGRNLYTGDIVLVYEGSNIGTVVEEWNPVGGLTAVVCNQYQSFTDGSIEKSDADPAPFVMGIRTCGFNNPEWQIHRVKSYTDVVEGEKWNDFGFSYQYSEKADML